MHKIIIRDSKKAFHNLIHLIGQIKNSDCVWVVRWPLHEKQHRKVIRRRSRALQLLIPVWIYTRWMHNQSRQYRRMTWQNRKEADEVLLSPAPFLTVGNWLQIKNKQPFTAIFHFISCFITLCQRLSNQQKSEGLIRFKTWVFKHDWEDHGLRQED